MAYIFKWYGYRSNSQSVVRTLLVGWSLAVDLLIYILLTLFRTHTYVYYPCVRVLTVLCLFSFNLLFCRVLHHHHLNLQLQLYENATTLEWIVFNTNNSNLTTVATPSPTDTQTPRSTTVFRFSFDRNRQIVHSFMCVCILMACIWNVRDGFFHSFFGWTDDVIQSLVVCIYVYLCERVWVRACIKSKSSYTQERQNEN